MLVCRLDREKDNPITRNPGLRKIWWNAESITQIPAIHVPFVLRHLRAIHTRRPGLVTLWALCERLREVCFSPKICQDLNAPQSTQPKGTES